MINTLRHNEIFNPHDYMDKKIVIVGAGAVGSRVFENLISVGLTNITLIDYDIVESHNLANQLFVIDDIDEPKVTACAVWCTAKAGADTTAKITFINNKVEKDSIAWFNDADIVISCVDSFDARRLIMEMAINSWSDLFVEASMATGHFNVFMVDPTNAPKVSEWGETLSDDDDPIFERSACGESLSVGDIASMTAATISLNVKNWLKSAYIEPKLRFVTAPFMINKVEIR